MAALRPPIICLVTDRRLLPDPAERNLIQLVASAAKAGVTLIHLRERDLDDRRLLAVAREAVAAVAGSDTRVLVNDRVDVALAAGAHGVHLRHDSPGADRIRPVTPDAFLIGRSVHDAAEAARAETTGVDYLVMGTVFPTPSKPDGVVPAGLHGLAQTCRAVSVPVLAIGGLTADNVKDIAATGAAGLAAIRLFADLAGGHREIDSTMRELVAGIRQAFAARSPVP